MSLMRLCRAARGGGVLFEFCRLNGFATLQRDIRPSVLAQSASSSSSSSSSSPPSSASISPSQSLQRHRSTLPLALSSAAERGTVSCFACQLATDCAPQLLLPLATRHSRLPAEPCRAMTTALTNLYVRNLPMEWTSAELIALGEKYGPVVSAKVLYNPLTTASRGMGFIRFAEHADATLAIAGMNGHIPDTVHAKPINVQFAKVSFTAAVQSLHRRIAAVRSLTRSLLSRCVLLPRSLAYVPSCDLKDQQSAHHAAHSFVRACHAQATRSDYARNIRTHSPDDTAHAESHSRVCRWAWRWQQWWRCIAARRSAL